MFVRPFVRLSIKETFMPTVREIARRAGVSKTTVSLVLNNKDGVSDALRQRVREALQALETPSSSKNGVDSGPTSVALLHAFSSSPQFFREILQGIQAAADRYQIQLRLLSVSRSEDDLLTDHLYFSDKQLMPDGVLVVASGTFDGYLTQLQQLAIPTVLVGGPTAMPFSCVVTPNEVEAGEQAAAYLLDRGHRAVAFAADSLRPHFARARFEGYLRAFEKRGLSTETCWHVVNPDSTAVAATLAANPEITAVIFSREGIAWDALTSMCDAGFTIPDKVSVVMFDDVEEASTFNPPLTTIAYPLYQQGYWALRMLIDQMREPEIEGFQMIFRTRLIERASCVSLK